MSSQDTGQTSRNTRSKAKSPRILSGTRRNVFSQGPQGTLIATIVYPFAVNNFHEDDEGVPTMASSY